MLAMFGGKKTEQLELFEKPEQKTERNSLISVS
jgi:hypothetical protein